MSRRRLRALALAVPVLAPLALALPASAHVTVNPSTATGGSYSKLTFRVPTESDTASTKKLVVFFPQSTPFASANVKPHPGWTFKVTDHKLAKPITSEGGQVTEAVQKITWTATSAATQIKPGEFDEFDISLGPLPTSGSLAFKALQYYTDGSVVRWIDPTVAGQPEPDHPAPVLTLTPATATADGTSGTTDPTTGTTSEATTASSDDPSHTPLILATIALVVSVAGTGIAVFRRRARAR